MPDINEIEAAVAMAEAETGLKGGKSKFRLIARPATRSRTWSKDEDRFLTENLGRLTEHEIAKRLGRSDIAVHLHSERDLGLARPSKSPLILTGEHIAMGLQLDGHSVARLIDRGLLPGRFLPFDGARRIRVVDRLVFMKWILDPDHWCYFKPKRVGAMKMRGRRGYTGAYDFGFWEEAARLVLARAKRWKDRWLTPFQAARQMKIRIKPRCPKKQLERPDGFRYVNAAIARGVLPATRWGNWWILKSNLPVGKTINFRGELVSRLRGRKR